MKGLGKCLLVVAFMVSLLFVAGNAGAYTFYLTKGNVAGSGEPDGLSIYEPNYFARVDVGLTDENSATIKFTALNNFMFYDSSIVNVNINSTSFSVTPPTVTGWTSSSGGQVDGFGNFNVNLNYVTAGGPSVNALSEITFGIENIGGTWSSDTVVLTDNNKKYLAAAHMGFTNNNGASFVNTGFAGGDGSVTTVAPPVPVPPTVWLLGAGLVGLWGVRRRFLKK